MKKILTKVEFEEDKLKADESEEDDLKSFHSKSFEADRGEKSSDSLNETEFSSDDHEPQEDGTNEEKSDDGIIPHAEIEEESDDGKIVGITINDLIAGEIEQKTDHDSDGITIYEDSDWDN